MGLFKRRDNAKSLRQNDNDETVDEMITEKKPWHERLDSVVGIFQFDRHRKIERRRLYFILATLVLSSGLSMGFWHSHVEAEKNALKTTAYNTDVAFSKTSTNMTLGRVTVSQDRHRAFIPFTFSSMDQLSTNAKAFMVMISASTGDLHYKPTGQLVLFGDSARGVIVMESATQIQNQPLTIYIRNDKNLRTGTSVDAENNDDLSDSQGLEKAQKKYDLLFFKVNPGAEETSKTKQFNQNAKSVTSKNLYKYFFVKPDMQQVKTSNKAKAKDIKLQTRIASEYTHRLSLAGYKVPKAPDWMKDDWKPYDFVDPETGKVGNGKHKTSATTETTSNDDGTSSNDPDSVQFPDDLNRKDGHGTMLSDNQNQQSNNTPASYSSNNQTNQDSSSVGGNNQAPTDIWNSLQSAWNTVHTDKRDMYVQNNSVIFNINAALYNQEVNSSVGPKSRFKVISKIVIQNN